jgi:thymidine kinase
VSNVLKVDFVTYAAESRCKMVIVAGLDGDFRRQKFGQLLDLVPLADSVLKVKGQCQYCSSASLFSFRISTDDRQELVGGGEKYVPTCRFHYLELARLRKMHE